MKKMMMLLMGVLVLALFVGISTAGDCNRDCDQNCCVCDEFVDVDGDGICDECGGCIPVPKGEDDDGDGIPNGQDDDYVPPEDGDGNKNGK